MEQLSTTFGGERNLLKGLRSSLQNADEATLSVAFASMAGVHLLRRQLEAVAKRNGVTLLVTTVFGSTCPAALQLARELGVDVRTYNRPSGTFHPKVYVARHDDQVDVITGSANLTGGLITNVEMATRLSGDMGLPELARTLQWARDLWESPEAIPWVPQGPTERETLYPALLAAITLLAEQTPTVHTLGRNPKPNTLVEVTPIGVYVETEKSDEEGAGPKLVDAWMLNVAWDYVRAHGSITNKFLIAGDGLNVKRSSAVCAILSRLTGMQPLESSVGIALRPD